MCGSRMLEEERARGAPIACMIESLSLAESRATLLLRDSAGASSSDSESGSSDGDSSGGDGGGAGDRAGVGTGDGAGDELGDGGGVPDAARARPRPQQRGPKAQRVVVDLTENAFGNAKQVRLSALCLILRPEGVPVLHGRCAADS